MNIPEQFTIHGHDIKVVYKEKDNYEDNRFGYYDSVKEEIVLFRKLHSQGEYTTITETQLEATFLHELFHAFQWHSTGNIDEAQSQTYSGLMIEFFKTSK